MVGNCQSYPEKYPASFIFDQSFNSIEIKFSGKMHFFRCAKYKNNHVYLSAKIELFCTTSFLRREEVTWPILDTS